VTSISCSMMATLKGTIPSQLSKLTNLKTLNLTYTSLTGTGAQLPAPTRPSPAHSSFP
jgi:hypothetical protein